MPRIQLSGGSTVNLVRAGPRGGAPLVFLHAVGLDLTWWDAQVAAFGRDHDVVAFDMPGHGLSEPLHRPPGFDALAGVLAEVLAHVDGGPAHLVGVSVGGMVAQALALARPDLVRSLSLVATLCTFPGAVRLALRERASLAREARMAAIVLSTQERWFPRSFRTARPDILDRAAKILLQQDPQLHAAMWDMIASLDLQAALPALRCPTMVVAGGEDPNAPPAAGRLIAQLVPGAVLHEVPGAGHFPPVEAPDVFNNLLRAFLDGQADRPTGAIHGSDGFATPGP